ncbi:unnamed protein product [Oreochromis niloticus]|nr:unnamed protein product [Mustela putorius furo]
MFYYPNVLQRHSGCFSTIWLAATKGIRVTRRELLRVNVKRTCGEILDYVTAQVPPPQPSLPKPRFSLYLSSQLQYGVVVVYHRQCGFLLEEVQQTIDRLLRCKRCVPIDMAESGRNALDMPDILYMMEEAEGAQDPFFGIMESQHLPSPYKLPQTGFVIEDVGSQHSLVPSPHTTRGFRSPPAAITLTEKEHFITAAEDFEGADLPEATAREIDLLMDQADQFHKDAEEQTEESSWKGAMSSADQLEEAVLGTDRDSVWLLDEETGQPMAVPLATIALEMTPVQVAMPSPPSGASGKEGDRTTERPCDESDVLLDFLSVTTHATPAQLFSTPCGSLLHTDLQTLWKRQASLAVLPRQEKEKGEEEEEEEERLGLEQEREIMRAERKRRHSSMKEIPSVSRLQSTEGSSVSDMMLDMSKEDRSVSDAVTPISRWSLQEEVQQPMEPIAEERIEMPEAQTDVDSRDMLSWITFGLQRFGEVTFDSLLPPEASRSTATDTFYKLLELLSAGQVTVHQTEPYSCITISSAKLTMAA